MKQKTLATILCIGVPLLILCGLIPLQIGDLARQDIDRQLVEECFVHEEEWKNEPNSSCHQFADSNTIWIGTVRQAYRRRMYIQMVQQNQQDQQIVLQCLLNQTLGHWTLSDQCHGVSWGKLLINKSNHTLRERQMVKHVIQFQEDINVVESCVYDKHWHVNVSHHCYLIMNSDNKHQTYTSRELIQKEMYLRFLEQDAKDRTLVRHCFNHLFDQYEPCRGFTWYNNVKIFSEKRHHRIHSLVNEYIDTIMNSENDYKQQFVASCCLFIQTWLNQPSHFCHLFVNINDINTKDNISGLFEQYEKLRTKNLVTDCFEYHQNDQFPACYGVSWDENANQNNFVPYKENHRQIWSELLKLDKCKTCC